MLWLLLRDKAEVRHWSAPEIRIPYSDWPKYNLYWYIVARTTWKPDEWQNIAQFFPSPESAHAYVRGEETGPGGRGEAHQPIEPPHTPLAFILEYRVVGAAQLKREHGS